MWRPVDETPEEIGDYVVELRAEGSPGLVMKTVSAWDGKKWRTYIRSDEPVVKWVMVAWFKIPEREKAR